MAHVLLLRFKPRASSPRAGMGKTKLLQEVRKSLERINVDTSSEGKPVFYLLYGIADIASKSQKLHPWRRIFQVSRGNAGASVWSVWSERQGREQRV